MSWIHGAGVRDEIVTLSSSSDGSLDVANLSEVRMVDGLVQVSAFSYFLPSPSQNTLSRTLGRRLIRNNDGRPRQKILLAFSIQYLFPILHSNGRCEASGDRTRNSNPLHALSIVLLAFLPNPKV